MTGRPVLEAEILTLFPDVVEAYLRASIMGRAQERGLLRARAVDLRHYGVGRHKITDDEPYGGGAGMVMKPEPFFSALDDLGTDGRERLIILLSPQGKPFCQDDAQTLSEESRALTFLCGRYEGIDDRVRTGLAHREYSLGDFVMTGGELAALAIIDASVRLVPGVLGDETSALDETFSGGLLEYPQYTRPPEYRGMRVPDVLLSGHHEAVRRWRRSESLKRTLEQRPDLLAEETLSDEDRALLRELKSRRS